METLSFNSLIIRGLDSILKERRLVSPLIERGLVSSLIKRGLVNSLIERGLVIRLLAEHNSIWHCDLTIKRLLASKCNKYILKYLQHTFPHTIKHTLMLYPSKSSEITTNHRHFRKLSDFSRNTIQFDTLRLTNQNTSRL